MNNDKMDEFPVLTTKPQYCKDGYPEKSFGYCLNCGSVLPKKRKRGQHRHFCRWECKNMHECER